MNQHSAPSRKAGLFSPGAFPGSLSADAAASLLSAVGDLTFILSNDGIILDVAVAQGDLANHGFADWVGESWLATMSDDRKAKWRFLDMPDCGAALMSRSS